MLFVEVGNLVGLSIGDDLLGPYVGDWATYLGLSWETTAFFLGGFGFTYDIINTTTQISKCVFLRIG